MNDTVSFTKLQAATERNIMSLLQCRRQTCFFARGGRLGGRLRVRVGEGTRVCKVTLAMGVRSCTIC